MIRFLSLLPIDCSLVRVIPAEALLRLLLIKASVRALLPVARFKKVCKTSFTNCSFLINSAPSFAASERFSLVRLLIPATLRVFDSLLLISRFNSFVSTPLSFPNAWIAARRVALLEVCLNAKVEVKSFSSEIFHFSIKFSDCIRIESFVPSRAVCKIICVLPSGFLAD